MCAVVKAKGRCVITAILFDLDGTLLDIDLDRFLRSYFSMLGPVIARLLPDGSDPALALQAVISGTEAMSAAHRGRSNKEVFNASFLQRTGVDLDTDECVDAIERFYESEFPRLREEHGPKPGARLAVETARAVGLKTALATNPIFPRTAIVERLAWAGLAPEAFDLITSYEVMSATKPHPDYFRQAADLLQVDPRQCLMVGDDPLLDLPASDIGMRTYFVGAAVGTVAHWQGGLEDLALLLPKMVG